MPLDEQTRRDIGRCIMVGVRGARPEHDALRRDLDACLEARCRAIVLFDRDMPTGSTRNIESPSQVTDLIAHIRATLGDDTLVAIDQEGGTVQRLRASGGFVESPSAAEFAHLDLTARLAAAKALACQLRALGIDINFAPCVDLDIPGSTIIGARARAFGSDPNLVVERASEVINAHVAARVVPCIKHFPGHGSARADSHLDLPDITEVWDEPRELTPFAALIRDHAPICVMTAHLLHRDVDPINPASLSSAWTTRILRDRLGFGGVVVTDSLDMRAIADRCPGAEAAPLGLRAGADVALDANNMPGPSRSCPAPGMAAAIARAIESGALDASAVHRSAQRIDEIARFTGRVAPGGSPTRA